MRGYVARSLLFVSLLLAPAGAVAQSNFARPSLDWMTVKTRHFDVHYPASMSEWTMDLTRRLDGVYDAVSAFVGYAPPHRITVIVEDPLSQSNGFANAPLNDPIIALWPTPPDPSGMLGVYRDWSELLAVHEFGHIAHLTRPTRNPRERRFWRLIPIRFGPVALRTPRWAVEGYATFIEGRLTGSGRPHGASRAAYLRQWALEGRLPTYAQLSSGGDFAAGAMAYLVGSAFLEWLADQHGDSSIVNVWRRLSARQPRSFAQAFAGVYGAMPDELYGRFTVEITRRALAVHDTLAVAGLDTGSLVQRRRWATGEPAVSHDGRHMAVELVGRTMPGSVVLWRTEERVDSARDRRVRERLLALDPEDVPAIEGEPRPKLPLAVLRPLRSRPFHSPRFFADTARMLVSHNDPLGDGAYRSDLYEWNYRSGKVRRLTHGASIRDADPFPDGKTAAGVRCENGLCDLVRVDLTTGAIKELRQSTPAAPYYRPRVSPDGRSIAVAVKRDDRWRIALVSVEGASADGEPDAVIVDPDDGANRYDVSFIAGGRGLVYVSDAGGIPNLEMLSLDDHTTRTVTRVASAVSAPAFDSRDTSVFFLDLHARGLDLRKLKLVPTASASVIALSSSLVPAVPSAPSAGRTFPVLDSLRPHPYGAGPHQHRILPGGSYSTEGGFITLGLMGIDPIGRFAYSVTGAIGERSTWRGGAISASWRGGRGIGPGLMTIDGTLFRAEQHPSAQRPFADAVPTSRSFLDATLTGATLGTSTNRDFGNARLVLRVGANLGTIQRPELDDGVRGLVFGEGRAGVRLFQRAGYRTDVTLGATASRGGTGGLGWARAIGSLSTDVATPYGGAQLDVMHGGSDGGGGTFERFAIGGWPTPLVDAPVLSQRIAMPALPSAFMIGTHFTTLRASTSFGVVRPFYWIGTTRQNLTGWARVAGVDVDYLTAAFPAFAIPAVSIRAGAAYSWDEPFSHRVGIYAGVTYRP
jgi:hypothetical protein